MPTYEYKCDACGHAFEKFQSMTSEPVKKCPVCGKNKVRRLISAGAGLIFKGSGFYITDYRDQGYKDKASADSGPKTDAKTETKSDGKTEAAPAAASSDSGSDKGSNKASDQGANKGSDKGSNQGSNQRESKPTGESKPVAKSETPAPAKTEAPPAAKRSSRKK